MENATTPINDSTYSRTGVNLKVVRRKAAVTYFLQDASQEYIDSIAVEMENVLLAHIYDLVNLIIYGNAGANAYEFSGINTYIKTNRLGNTRYGTDFTDLSVLDNMIDKSDRAGGVRHRRVFVMSPEMLSKVSRLITNVRDTRPVSDTFSVIEFNGGWRLNGYRNIPIIVSTGTRPIETMGTVTPSTATTGGTIAASTTYYFKVTKETRTGESLAYATSQATGSGTSTNTITLTWTADTNAYRYRIYASTTQNAETLVKVVAAQTYDGTGTITGNTTSTTFTAAPAADSSVVDSTVGFDMSADKAFEQESNHDVPESVFLWDLDEIQGLGKVVFTNSEGSNFGGLVTTKPLAETDDFYNFLTKSYCALVPSFEKTSCVYRGLRTF